MRIHGKRVLMLMLLSVAWGCTASKQPDSTAAGPGVPVYPGAKSAASDRWSQHLLPRDRARLVRATIYETEDPVVKVVAFYEEKLKGKAQVLRTKTGGLPSAVIRAEVDGRFKLLIVTANEDLDRTEIVIGDITQPKKEN